jgi:hypothetical protein
MWDLEPADDKDIPEVTLGRRLDNPTSGTKKE